MRREGRRWGERWRRTKRLCLCFTHSLTRSLTASSRLAGGSSREKADEREREERAGVRGHLPPAFLLVPERRAAECAVVPPPAAAAACMQASIAVPSLAGRPPPSFPCSTLFSPLLITIHALVARSPAFHADSLYRSTFHSFEKREGYKHDVSQHDDPRLSPSPSG